MSRTDDLLNHVTKGNIYVLDDADIVALAVELQELRTRINSAPLALMDTRIALGVCALKEEDFTALQAIQGKRVRLVVDEDKE